MMLATSESSRSGTHTEKDAGRTSLEFHSRHARIRTGSCARFVLNAAPKERRVRLENVSRWGAIGGDADAAGIVEGDSNTPDCGDKSAPWKRWEAPRANRLGNWARRRESPRRG
jgi:hypothetical protein